MMMVCWLVGLVGTWYYGTTLTLAVSVYEYDCDVDGDERRMLPNNKIENTDTLYTHKIYTHFGNIPFVGKYEKFNFFQSFDYLPFFPTILINSKFFLLSDIPM